MFRNVPDLQHRTKDATIGRSKDLRTERFLGIVLFDVKRQAALCQSAESLILFHPVTLLIQHCCALKGNK